MAAVCPDGKLDVDGSDPNRGSEGRGRSTSVLTARNVASSRVSARTRNSASQRSLKRSKTIVATMRTASIPNVSATLVAEPVQWFTELVRLSTNQRTTCSSHCRTAPIWCVINKPMPAKTRQITR